MDDKIEDIVLKYLDDCLTEQEAGELTEWLNASASNRRLFIKCLKVYKNARQLHFLDCADREKSWEELQQRLKRYRRRSWLQRFYYAAALIVLLIGIQTYFRLRENSSVVSHEVLVQQFPHQGIRKAVLKLSGGKEVILGQGNQQKIRGEAEGEIVKDITDHLYYNQVQKPVKKLVYNEIFVPRGGEYSLTLSDGTRVWLNADSKLKYPVVFSDTLRQVELWGEAFFEVNRDEKKRFVVSVEGSKVTVTGTKFNVSAYDSQSFLQTTLVEGAVRFENGDRQVELKPSQQVSMDRGMNTLHVMEVDINLYTSWVDGIFEFKDTPLLAVVAQLSRWYDADIAFASEDLKEIRFAGVIQRNKPMAFAVEVIEKVLDVKFKKEENGTIIITNQN